MLVPIFLTSLFYIVTARNELRVKGDGGIKN